MLHIPFPFDHPRWPFIAIFQSLLVFYYWLFPSGSTTHMCRYIAVFLLNPQFSLLIFLFTNTNIHESTVNQMKKRSVKDEKDYH